MPEDLKLRLLRNSQELGALSLQWSAVWREDSNATPFQSPEWLLPWWHQFGQGELRTVVLTRNDRVIGLLPFYLYREPESGQRQLLPVGVGTTDYLDGTFGPACGIEDVQRAIDLLCAEEGWDVFSAPQLRPGSKLFQALTQSSALGRNVRESEACSRMAAVRMAELPQKIRRNAMYYRNRAMRRGALRLTVANSSTCAESLDALCRLHTERWENRGQSGVLVDNRVLAWHREATPLLERAGMLRLCSLRLDGEIIAVLYSLLDPPARAVRTQYFYLTAYSTRHAALRPGTLLLAFAIDRAATEGIRTIDMLRGDEDYKRLWHMEKMPTYRFFLSAAEHRKNAAQSPEQASQAA